ncbi:TetR/AcrR family transcriptional regulator [Streptomyces pinistramenti]|uniref:TetR/AcrR family transcriptional regulator n=1 Tax=Streptomyces pinistramenti TaxID=2884812 RepID=UPI001D088175|nr:TetR/AcrR family transcriptional regulator [Streptomyces pinistramenti]MCB5911434.1 TetR/AcrR family transcriptional regulator [Streptomyces pinistramenti]
MATGRPREFDLDERLDRALQVFWKHGYEGTGLSDLTCAMGISRPSLYAAYGNKEALFRKVLDRYLDGPAQHVRTATDEPTARAAAEHLLRGAVEVSTSEANPDAGCLIVQSALATGEQAGPVREDLKSCRRAGDAALRARFERAQAEGDLAQDADAADLARFITVISYGLSVQAAGGTDRAALHRAVDIAMSQWPDAPR